MRPVNLIPPEDRRGDKAPLRTGPIAYVVVAVLALALIGITLVVLTNNQIADRRAERESLQGQVEQAQAEAAKLGSFVDFASLQQAREQTVASLATSRFDWERVLRELAIVIPPDVWLTNLDAQASADAAVSGTTTGSSSSSEDIQGPSLDIQGCATGHDAVARFLAALHEIDGVTRATVLSSDRQGASGGGATSAGTSAASSGAGGGMSCASRDFISTFEVMVAFDAAQPASTSAAASPSTGAPTTQAPPPATSTGAGTDQTQASTSPGKGEAGKGQDGGETFVSGTGTAP